MKRILITGSGSYIGTTFESYIKQFDGYAVDTVDMMDGSWREKDLSGYDAVFHVAGLAHSDVGNVTEAVKAKYYKVNTDLTIETAKKAKNDGAKQFIFMSSAIVYGDSKLQAEKGIMPLADESFKVVILRPPMIYGSGSKGNYPILSKLARKCPVFPYVKNQRSMLYVENLCEFVRLMVENKETGVFFPQNKEYSNTSEMVRMIAESHGKKLVLVKGFGWALKIMSHITGLVNKAFGNMRYDLKMSEYKENYRVCGLNESIKRTET